MNTTARHGATPVRLTIGNWIALAGMLSAFALPVGGYAISLGQTVQKHQVERGQDRKDIDAILQRLDKLTDGLTQTARLDERIAGIERRLARIEDKLDSP